MKTTGSQPTTSPSAPSAAPASAAIRRERTFNRRAFGNLDTTSPLLQLYCTLIAVELALKDDTGAVKIGHKVIEQAKSYKIRDIDLAADGLENTLKQLICTDLNGLRANVVTTKYPEVRYIRHESDFPGDTTQASLEAARDAARVLRRELDRYWKSQNKPGVIP